jgi:hypothetical protein
MPGTLAWQRPAQHTNAQLTDAVGTHRTGGHDPIGRLLAEGIVLICTEFPPRRLMSYLWLRVDPARLDHVGTALAGHTPIRFAAAVTGPHNMVAAAITRNSTCPPGKRGHPAPDPCGYCQGGGAYTRPQEGTVAADGRREAAALRLTASWVQRGCR